jgi:hypothetical protein
MIAHPSAVVSPVIIVNYCWSLCRRIVYKIRALKMMNMSIR